MKLNWNSWDTIWDMIWNIIGSMIWNIGVCSLVIKHGMLENPRTTGRLMVGNTREVYKWGNKANVEDSTTGWPGFTGKTTQETEAHCNCGFLFHPRMSGVSAQLVMSYRLIICSEISKMILEYA